MPEKHPEVSIVIVSFNTKEYLKNCLDSIFQYTTGLKYEVIVVDNASTDGSREYLTKLSNQKKIKYIGLPDNVGFGAGNNRGVSIAKGDLLLFLNSDTLLTENSILIAARFMRKHPNVGAFSCRLTYKDGRTQPTGGYFPTLMRLIAWQLFLDDIPLLGRLVKSIHPKSSYYRDNCYLDWITGAFMMMPRELFVTVGGFDEKIFLYVEELELCFRIRKLNRGIVYRTNTSITHFGGASGGSHLALTLEIKYMVYFYQKHLPAWQGSVAKQVFKAGCLLRWLLFGIIGRNEVASKAYKQAYLDLT